MTLLKGVFLVSPQCSKLVAQQHITFCFSGPFSFGVFFFSQATSVLTVYDVTNIYKVPLVLVEQVSCAACLV